MEHEDMNMKGANMGPMRDMNMKGANMDPLSAMPAEARENLMKPSDEIRAVLVSRLANMSQEELSMLDQAITPEVAEILMKLLPELQQLVDAVASQRMNQMPQQDPMDNRGALSAM